MTKRATAALFDPQRLRIAREFNGLRRSDLAVRIGLSSSAITQIENGQTKPSSAHLAQISLALGFPIDFFLEDGRRPALQDDRTAFFRSLRSTKQIDRDRAASRAYLVSELIDLVQRYVRLPTVNLPNDLYLPDAADRDAIEGRAQEVRRRWNVPDGPIANVVRLLELNGVIVTHCIFDCREMSSFSRWFGRRPVVVLKEERDDLARLRSDAAHELGHLVLHEEPEAGNQVLETQAQAFAASFLTPAEQILPALPKSFDMDRYVQLKRTWGVSIAALLYRARELGRMSESTYRRAMIVFSKNRWRSEEPFPLLGREETQLLDRAMDVLQNAGKSSLEVLQEARLPADFLAQVTPSRAIHEVVL